MEKEIRKWIKKVQRKSDREAADQLISYYYKEIYAYLYKQSPVKDLAEDLTQETFMSMLQTIQSYDEKKAMFRTWLYKIATYQIVRYYRSKAYRSYQTADPIEDDLIDEQDFSLDLDRRIEVEGIMEIVETLDTIRQQIFRLKIFGEYPFIQIGQLLNIPESTVKTNYYATIKLIKKQVKQEEETA